jgi:hypothetical protein
MRKIEIILLINCLFAIFYKYFNFPLNSLYAFISLTVLSVIYFTLSWLLFNKPKTRIKNIIVNITIGAVNSTCIVSILYVIQNWNGFRNFFILAIILCVITISVIIVFYFKDKEKVYEKFYITHIFRILLIHITLFLTYFIFK